MSAAAITERSRTIMLLVIAANLLLVIHLLVYLLGSFPEFDLASRIKLWVGIAAALGFAAASIRIRQAAARIPRQRGHRQFVLGAASFLLMLALVPVPPHTFPSVAHVHTLLTFVLTFWVFYDALFDGNQSVRNVRLWLAVGIVGAVVVSLIRVYGLSVYPFVDVQDEAWTTAWTVSWMRTGRFGDPTLGGLGDAYYAYPRYYWLMGIWMRLVGVGLWQGRLLGFLLIFPLIGITAWVARAWYGKVAAVLTGFFMLCSAVLISAARIRHDIGLTLCLAGSLGLFTVAIRRRSPFFHFVAGFVMVCGMFSHYHGAGLSIVMFVGLYAPRYIAQLRSRAPRYFWLPEAGVWLYASGAILGGLAVLFIQMIPDDLPGWLWTLRQQSLYSSDTGEFFISLLGNVFNVAFFSIFEFILVALGVVAAIRRRSLQDVSLLLILALGLIALAVMGSGAIYYYILPLVPIYSLLIGRMFFDGIRPGDGLLRRQAVVFVLLLIPLLGATTGRSLQAVVNGEPLEPPPPPAVQWIRDNVPTDAEVVADMHYYFWLNDYEFTSHLVPEYLYPDNMERFPTLEAVWDAVDMDVLVIDPSFSRSYRLYFQPLLETGLVAEKYAVAAEMPTAHGTITIYERRLTSPAPPG